MKIQHLTLGAGALVVILFAIMSVAHADTWWRPTCPDGARMQVSGGNIRCVANVGGVNKAPTCPGEFGLQVQTGTDICTKGNRAEDTRPVKCEGDRWHVIPDGHGQQDQCVRGTNKQGEKAKNARCVEGFTYKVQPGDDLCYRAGKAGKTKPYKCAAGRPTIDSEGPNDRCIDPGTMSYVEPSLSRVAQ